MRLLWMDSQELAQVHASELQRARPRGCRAPRARYLGDLHPEREREATRSEPDGYPDDALAVITHHNDASVVAQVVDLTPEEDRQRASAKSRARQQIRKIRVVDEGSSGDARCRMTIAPRKRPVI